MNNRILLINTNRYMDPPVIPLGIEYLVNSLMNQSFEVEVLDLCFAGNPIRDIEQSIKDFQPGAVCMSIRNVDSVLYPGTDYFLPEIRGYIQHVRTLSDAPVIIGGSAIPADPEGILTYVGADTAINGPGEETLPELLKDDHLLREKGRVIRGKPPASFCPQRGVHFSYKDYLDKDGLPGFETHKGCSSNCVYCMEAGSPVRFREPSDVVRELRSLADRGFHHLHLCDTEFNEDLDYCLNLLEAMNQEKLGLKWGLYMKPGHYNPRLFELLKQSGAYLVTLSVETFKRGEAYWNEINEMITLCKKAGIRISIDFLTGFPYEDEDTLKRSLDFFRRCGPDEVVVNVFLRLYKQIKITEIIRRDPSLKKHLIVSEDDDGSMLAPVFYNHLPVERLRELINKDPLFRVAGAEKVVNYQKA